MTGLTSLHKIHEKRLKKYVKHNEEKQFCKYLTKSYHLCNAFF